MKSKWKYALVLVNALAITAAFAGERKDSDVSVAEGLDSEAQALCAKVVKDAPQLPRCDQEKDVGLPREVSVDESCSFYTIIGLPGEEDVRIGAKAHAHWVCDTK